MARAWAAARYTCAMNRGFRVGVVGTSLLLGGLAVAGCDKKEEGAGGQPAPTTEPATEGTAAKHKADPSAGALPTPKPASATASNPAPFAGRGMPCEKVVGRFSKEFLDGDADAEKAMLAACETTWSVPMRSCVFGTTSEYGTSTCAREVTREECGMVVQRLIDLATHEKKTDASLAGKRDDLASLCAETKPEVRICLMRAESIAQYAACEGAESYGEVAATTALGWEAKGAVSWTWPEYYRGAATERLTTDVVVIDGMHTRPSLRIQCKDNALKTSIWAKATLAEDGAAAAPVSLDVVIDGEAMTYQATIEMGEHLVFVDPAKLAEALPGAKEMTTRYKHPSLGELELRFAVDGTAAALEKLACGG